MSPSKLTTSYFLSKLNFILGTRLLFLLAIKIVWTGISDALCGYFRAAEETLTLKSLN